MNLYKIRETLKSTWKETNQEFIKRVLKDRVLSDEQIIDIYFRNKFFWKASSICKKWESLRKLLSTMRLKWKLKEVKRTERDISCEIFYKLNQELWLQ